MERNIASGSHFNTDYLWRCQEFRAQLSFNLLWMPVGARQGSLWICLPYLVMRARSYLSSC